MSDLSFGPGADAAHGACVFVCVQVCVYVFVRVCSHDQSCLAYCNYTNLTIVQSYEDYSPKVAPLLFSCSGM